MTPEGELAPRPESPKLKVGAMAVVWALCLSFTVVCYFLFHIEYHGFITARRGPVDPVWSSLTVAGMIAGVAAPTAVSYAVLRSWRLVAAAALVGGVVGAVTLQLLFLTVLGIS